MGRYGAKGRVCDAAAQGSSLAMPARATPIKKPPGRLATPRAETLCYWGFAAAKPLLSGVW
ncbi:hypothetical protein thsps117_03630 [Pseudomonas sp. No.117]